MDMNQRVSMPVMVKYTFLSRSAPVILPLLLSFLLFPFHFQVIKDRKSVV